MTTQNMNHIVLIDDDADIQDLIVNFFKPRGYQFSLFYDAETALNRFKEGMLCDVLITDLVLPKMSGIDLTQKIKEINPELPIIVMTATKTAETAIKAIQHGAYDFIVKPLHFPQLLVSVERAIQLKNLKQERILNYYCLVNIFKFESL